MRSAPVVAALDIGGTHVTAGRVDIESRRVDAVTRVRLALPPAGEPPPLGRIVEAALAVAGPDVRALGVAVPGPFDYAAGVSRISHKLKQLYGVDLRRELGTALDLPGEAIAFLNDADAFLLGEWWAGAARDHARALGITLGSGLGSAFLERGSIVHSGPGVRAGGELYRLDFRGSPVEDTISRGALLAAYADDSKSGVDVEAIAARARASEDRARLVFRALGADLAEFLTPTLEAFAPSCLVVGGSIARAWSLLEPALVERLTRFPTLVVARAANLDDAPLLGAARHAATHDVRERVE